MTSPCMRVGSPVSAHVPAVRLLDQLTADTIHGILQGGRDLELLKGITGAFRPGVLTALMGEIPSTGPSRQFNGTHAAHACTASARP